MFSYKSQLVIHFMIPEKINKGALQGKNKPTSLDISYGSNRVASEVSSCIPGVISHKGNLNSIYFLKIIFVLKFFKH